MVEHGDDTDGGDLGDDDLEECVPDPRANGDAKVVKFNFTPRIFPTPMRESKASEEEDWVAKNRTHLRRNPQLKPQLDALDIEDSDPTWLKGKGDDFYRSRDYRAAVNAYTTALELHPTLQVLGNRSACYLQLGELVRCCEDCSELLELLDKEAMSVNANPSDAVALGMRLKALCRRGTAKCQQGLYKAALQDYHQAVNLNPADEVLTADLRKVFSLTKCDDLKKRADACLGEGSVDQALALYGEALAAEPGFVSAISNRAACLLATGDLEGCVRDCTKALDLLEVDPAMAAVTEMHLLSGMGAPAYPFPLGGGNSKSGVATMMPTGPVPPVGSQKRRTWVLKTVARRGAARAKLGLLGDAVHDYALAVSLLDDDKEGGQGGAAGDLLRKDLEALQVQLKEQQQQQQQRQPRRHRQTRTAPLSPEAGAACFSAPRSPVPAPLRGRRRRRRRQRPR
mmetsp:Transcript_86095/g.172394  ORF Transcript_86095/g.172394 Transcript_86095/m.172394 type:complete len:455 (+) Transcript_86095:2161-3525(+)